MNLADRVNTMTALAELLREAAPIVDPARAVAIVAEMLAPSRRENARRVLRKMLMILEAAEGRVAA